MQESLRQDNLSVIITDARHHKAKDGEEATDSQHRLQIASIEDRSRKYINDDSKITWIEPIYDI